VKVLDTFNSNFAVGKLQLPAFFQHFNPGHCWQTLIWRIGEDVADGHESTEMMNLTE